MVTTASRARSRLARRLSWLVVFALASAALFVPAASPALAAGPGNNGNGWPDGGPKSNSSIDEDPALVANKATMGTGSIACTGSSVNSFTGTFTLSDEFDDGSTIVVYLAANNGSNATPAENVSKNYAVVQVDAVGTYGFTIPIAHPFTATNGGVLIVFAVNDDGTVISSSKSNSLNCTESTTPTSSPTSNPTSTPTSNPTSTPTSNPTSTPTSNPTSTPTSNPTSTPTSNPTSTPTGDPTPTPEIDEASILIAKVDNNGTADPSDDVLLDGAEFEVYLDDGDGIFETDQDTLVFGEDPAVDGLLDTDPLGPGWYWIAETIVPDGYEGSDPILVQLNLDPGQTCVWDAAGLIECTPNEGQVEGLSWTVVIVDNTPEAQPTGGVGGATGTPGPRVTLPPTDTLPGMGTTDPTGESWRLVLLAMAGVLAGTLLLTPARAVGRTGDRNR